MASHDQVVARPGPRGAGVIERAGGLEISKCLIDNAVGKSPAMQSVAKLARRELAAAEEEQGGRPSGSRSGILHDLWLTPGHARMVHRPPKLKLGPTYEPSPMTVSSDVRRPEPDVRRPEL